MSKLLVSVRSAMEATVAIEAGAEVIDVKEPTRGSLGAADAATIEDVVRAVAGRVPVSAALGELDDVRDQSHIALPPGISYAKLGLARCGVADNWVARWRHWIECLPRDVRPVAVVYADWQLARAPQPQDVLSQAMASGVAAVLVDTFDKSMGGLLSCWSQDELRRFAEQVRRGGMKLAVAGGLRRRTISTVRYVDPDYIAVRGAVCRGGREGTLDARRVSRIARLVRHHSRLSDTISA